MATAKKPAAKNEPEAAGAVTIEALDPIRHNGADIAPGETVTVTAEQAAALIAAGAARAAG
jgi:hypothetical protein